MSDHNPPPGGNALHSQLMNLNIGAQPFVPNARAAAFVPMSGGGHPPPGYVPYGGQAGGYNMQGGGRYNPSHMGMHPQMHPQGQPGGYGGLPQQHGRGMPYNPRDYHPSMGGGHPRPRYTTGPPPPSSHYPSQQQQQQQQQHVFAQHPSPAPSGQHPQPQPHPSTMHTTTPHSNLRAGPAPPHSSSSSLGQPRGQPPPTVAPPQEDPVDSWEQMAGDDGGSSVPEKSVEPTSQVKEQQQQQPGQSTGITQDNPVKEPAPSKVKSSSGKEASKSATPPLSTSAGSAQLSTTTLQEGSGGSNSTGGSSSKKNLSPHLSKSSRGEGASSKNAQSMVVPPKDKDEKENLNVIFIGHVDAGKSTIGGHIMFLTGQVDKRTLEKYEREAKEKNRETWYLSWALDTNQEERDKGKTVEVGRAAFETTKKRFTILDAPGHAGFVPNMIGGAAQADIGVLVISARKGEFETGFERKGQTREHAMLAKTAGVKHLIVLVNKMDDPTVEWVEERFEECKVKLTPFLRKVGFNPKTDLFFIPVSGLTGANLKESSLDCPWYKGPPFISYLDNLPTIVREDNGILRMPIADKHKDMGTLVMGKIESGAIMKSSSLLLMPNKVNVEVLQVIRVEEEVSAAYAGDNVKLRLKGVEEEDISAGFVLCDPSSPCSMGQVFDAQIVVLEYKSIICAGYTAVLHIHTVVEEVQILELKAIVDRKTGKCSARNPRFVKQDQVVIATLQTNGVICLETFKDFPQMARFTLRDEGKTVAIGKVLKLLSNK